MNSDKIISGNKIRIEIHDAELDEEVEDCKSSCMMYIGIPIGWTKFDSDNDYISQYLGTNPKLKNDEIKRAIIDKLEHALNCQY